MKFHDILLAFVIALLWGFNYVAVKSSVIAFQPLTAMAFRYLCVVLFLLPYLLKLPRQHYLPLFKISLTLGTLYFGFFFWAAHHVSASLAAVILQLQVPFSVIFSCIFLKESPGPLAILGTLIAFLGVFYAVGELAWQSHQLLSIILLFAAAMSWAYGNIMVRRMRLNLDALSLNAGIAFCSLPFFIISSFIMEPGAIGHVVHIGLKPWAFLFYMVIVSTLFCYSNWFRLLQTYNVALVTPFMLLVPIFALFCDHWFLNEPMTHYLVVGGGITVLGVGLVVLPKSIHHIIKKMRVKN